MGIRLKEGRFFTAQDGRDRDTKDGVIIVNETFARTIWPEGERPRQAHPQGREGAMDDRGRLFTDVKHYGLERPMRPGVLAAPCRGCTLAHHRRAEDGR